VAAKFNAIVIHPDDNVATVTEAVPDGGSIYAPGLALTARGEIPALHKVAIRRIAQGDPVFKYGQFIGAASVDIESGQWVHLHNFQAEGK